MSDAHITRRFQPTFVRSLDLLAVLLHFKDRENVRLLFMGIRAARDTSLDSMHLVGEFPLTQPHGLLIKRGRYFIRSVQELIDNLNSFTEEATRIAGDPNVFGRINYTFLYLLDEETGYVVEIGAIPKRDLHPSDEHTRELIKAHNRSNVVALQATGKFFMFNEDTRRLKKALTLRETDFTRAMFEKLCPNVLKTLIQKQCIIAHSSAMLPSELGCDISRSMEVNDPEDSEPGEEVEEGEE